MVREGLDFQVEDAKTGEDLTEVVLAQVVLEEVRRGEGNPLPLELLKQLIRLRDGAMHDFVVHHLPRLSEIYLDARAALSNSLEIAVHHTVEPGEAAVISQLVAVKSQMEQILDVLDVEVMDPHDA